MGPKGKLEKNDKPQFINRIGIYENHRQFKIGKLGGSTATMPERWQAALAA
jgi:hypothetical protein